MKTLHERIESLDDYQDQAETFLRETGSTIEWKLNGLSNRFNGPSKTLEYSYTIKRGLRTHSGLFNSSLADLEKLFGNRYGLRWSALAFQDALEKLDQLIRNQKPCGSRFLDNLVKHKKIPLPTAYDLLACLDITYCDSLDEFVNDFGYQIGGKDGITLKEINAIWETVQKQNTELLQLYNDDELLALNSIA